MQCSKNSCDKILTEVEHQIQELNETLAYDDILIAKKQIKRLKEAAEKDAIESKDTRWKENLIKRQERFVELLSERTDISKKFRLIDSDKESK
jgi:hypothetical protein